MQEADTLLTDMLVVDRSRGEPMHRQLYRQVREMILDGSLPHGWALPPSRQLARELGVSRNTVTAAYDQLQAEGLTEAVQGSATRTIDIASGRQPARPRGALAATVATATRLGRLPPAAAADGHFGGDALLPGFPDPREFPTRIWNRLSHQAGSGLGALFPDLDPYGGFLPLRRALAQYLRLSRGITADPGQIFITAGASQSLLLITRALTDSGDTVWLENPAYGVASLALQLADLDIEAVNVDAQGPQPPDAADGSPRLIYLTTSYQYPLGITMPVNRRLQWLDLAQRHNAWIIEDDYDGEFRYHGDPIPALAGLLNNQRTLYMGTFSKVLSPTLRMSYLVAPPATVDSMRQVYPMLGNESSIITQAILADFINSGYFSRHIKRMRTLYGERREALEDSLARHAGLVSSRKQWTPGGLHIPVGIDIGDGQLLQDTVAAGLGCLPLSDAYVSGPAEQGFLLGFTSREPEAIESAVREFSRLLDKRRGTPGFVAYNPQPAEEGSVDG